LHIYIIDASRPEKILTPFADGRNSFSFGSFLDGRIYQAGSASLIQNKLWGTVWRSPDNIAPTITERKEPMKKLLFLLVVVALVMAVATPALAAPDQTRQQDQDRLHDRDHLYTQDQLRDQDRLHDCSQMCTCTCPCNP
jgi:hypothetical protein